MKKLGKGLDAIIGVDNDRAIRDDRVGRASRAKSRADPTKSAVNADVFSSVVSDAIDNPRLTFWSPKAAAVLRYLKKTIPEFSISSEIAKLVEEAVRNRYPDLWSEAEKVVSGGNSVVDSRRSTTP